MVRMIVGVVHWKGANLSILLPDKRQWMTIGILTALLVILLIIVMVS